MNHRERSKYLKMNNNFNKKLENVLSSMNPAELQRLMKFAKGSQISSRLSESDKRKIMEEFSGLDTNMIKGKLSSLKAEDLSGLSVDEILRKIRKMQ